MYLTHYLLRVTLLMPPSLSLKTDLNTRDRILSGAKPVLRESRVVQCKHTLCCPHDLPSLSPLTLPTCLMHPCLPPTLHQQPFPISNTTSSHVPGYSQHVSLTTTPPVYLAMPPTRPLPNPSICIISSMPSPPPASTTTHPHTSPPWSMSPLYPSM
ncbi:hypothetical protein E2C01_005401 [Portunus trituberculatus]|uniref:Uncharacterized protein n=1 Tax=Portunus trituberculatus TaxID=210409 RepID=A0A5B7CSE6_PORTR|nr:hypothetical protein [Portunus trituberculatus]